MEIFEVKVVFSHDISNYSGQKQHILIKKRKTLSILIKKSEICEDLELPNKL